MDTHFWLKKWEANEIAFHLDQANPLLVEHFDSLELALGSRVFLPLCGKTLDIPWLLSNGYSVVGAELSVIAIEQLFEQLGVVPTISPVGSLHHYSSSNIDIFVGNLFDLTQPMLGQIDAIYDRAALVALPDDMRKRYTAHLIEITQTAPQLLICFEYDQSVVAGPPFSIHSEEVQQHYQATYALTPLANVSVDGGLRGKYPAQEQVWLLKQE